MAASYTYADVTSPDYIWDSLRIENDYGAQDGFIALRDSESRMLSGDATIVHRAYAYLSYRTTDLSWFTSLDYVEGLGLSGEYDSSEFYDVTHSVSLATDFSSDFSGLRGTINWTSAEVTTSVPEPGTLALFSVGLLGVAALRRKRSS